jgi:secondary thiamine-phosphate synthase enzyme
LNPYYIGEKKMLKELTVHSKRRNELIDITAEVLSLIKKSALKEASVNLYVPHTTAGIIINENADPSVKQDILNSLSKLVPASKSSYTHLEGNADSHIKSSLVGISACIPIKDGELLLGTWQGIFFAEFDGPRTRKVIVQIIPVLS